MTPSRSPRFRKASWERKIAFLDSRNRNTQNLFLTLSFALTLSFLSHGENDLIPVCVSRSKINNTPVERHLRTFRSAFQLFFKYVIANRSFFTFQINLSRVLGRSNLLETFLLFFLNMDICTC